MIDAQDANAALMIYLMIYQTIHRWNRREKHDKIRQSKIKKPYPPSPLPKLDFKYMYFLFASG
jgi:hypothetical protein